MRDRVPTTEVVVGVVVLLVLAGMVAVTIAVATRPQPALFELRPGVERGSPLNRERQIARQMMPGLGTAGWSLQDGVQVLDRSALEAAGEPELVEVGAVWVYRGVYANPASGESVSVQIVDAGSPDNAFGLYRQRRPDGATALAMGNEGWQADRQGAFWAGRYCTEFDRSNVRSAEPSARTIADALGSVQIAYGIPFRAEEQTSPFPAIDVDAWGEVTGFREYTPANLWEKINGRAEIYLQFGMQRMSLGTYRHAFDPSLSVDVYWYEMTEPDGAFGIYRAESGGRVTQIDVGDEGYGSGGTVVFRKGRDYVRVEASGEGESLEAAGPAIARAIAGRIEDTGQPLWADSLLPAEGRTSEALDYHGENAFSLDFLRDVFSADYSAGGRTFSTFVHRAADEAETRRLLDAYTAFFEEYGRVIERDRVDGIEFVVGESGGIVDAAFAAGVYLGGVNNCTDATLAKERAMAFARAIASNRGS